MNESKLTSSRRNFDITIVEYYRKKGRFISFQSVAWNDKIDESKNYLWIDLKNVRN